MTDRDRAALWIALLTAASLGTTWSLACMTPFAALAALAAMHLRRRDGLTLMGLAWAASQLVGFGLLGYPHDPATLAWGAGIGFAALASALAAYGALALLPVAATSLRLTTSFAAAFLGFKLGLTPFALVLGGIDITWSPTILAAQLPREAAILMVLFALYHVLVRLGVPEAREPVRAS